ncbi:hypothetical protein CMUS01_04543 [Colletotrichum musicola]|uniref:Uncharacterized protein n=1 Tax=Colletotrichum musicola TaxID=2175873 RepID=A0A8H6KVZ4_9PEZI|nr:hypothetical protein CMUS01_04543 [Colletotrichum musicola]
MQFANRLLTFVAVMLFAGAGVEAACATEAPGTPGFPGSFTAPCIGKRTRNCGPAPEGGPSILCCDTACPPPPK